MTTRREFLGQAAGAGLAALGCAGCSDTLRATFARAAVAPAADGFVPLPLKQIQAPAQIQAGAQTAGPARLGQHIDITI